MNRSQIPEPHKLPSRSKGPSTLLPAFEFSSRPEKVPRSTTPDTDPFDSQLADPAEIERPRSALHAGNFDSHSSKPPDSQVQITPEFEFPKRGLNKAVSDASPTPPWFAPNPPIPSPFQNASLFPPSTTPIDCNPRRERSRAPSLQSYSSSFVFKTPTSPLVQQSNNDDLDCPPIKLSTSPDKSNRRHTLPPNSLSSLDHMISDHPLTYLHSARYPPSIRKESTFPYQTHHARRSITTPISLQAATTPPNRPSLQSRRTSLSSHDASPLQHASMVGSYEESILRGRMSTGPSKPLDFTAKIGALGKGTCKPKHPDHVTVPFPAVYYNWNTGAGRTGSGVDTEPSPYVGHIDLEHLLPPKPVREKQKRQRECTGSAEVSASGEDASHQKGCAAMNLALRKREKKARRSESPKAPLGGCYRIPRTGQLQILIKNPNKSAVKLFLVPYDLEGMEPGSKTFIRQRCFSAGPIIEQPISSASPSSTPGSVGGRVDSRQKPTLRYLIHLNICCPSKGRYYLYQHIRVVFANRVPDNKESLRTEIQLPEPRYSVYKANREASATSSTLGHKLVDDKVQRRRSYGYGFGSEMYDAIDGLPSTPRASGNAFSFESRVAAPPVPPIPFHLGKPKKEFSPDHHPPLPDFNDDHPMDLDSPPQRPPSSSDLQSPLSDKTTRIAQLAGSYKSSSSQSSDGYSKLNKGDIGYGGFFGRPGTPEPGEGLLARKLRRYAEAERKRDEDS